MIIKLIEICHTVNHVHYPPKSKSDIGLFLQLDLGCKLNDLNNSYVSQSVSVVSLYRMSLLTLLYPHCCNAGTKYTAFISVRFLSVLCGHSGFFIPATTANDLRL